MPEGEGTYNVIYAGDRQIGGIMKLPPAQVTAPAREVGAAVPIGVPKSGMSLSRLPRPTSVATGAPPPIREVLKGRLRERTSTS
jgi:hypothetical protein